MVGSFTKVLSGNMDFKKSKSSHLGMATMPPIKMVMTVDGLDVIVNMIHPFNHIYIPIVVGGLEHFVVHILGGITPTDIDCSKGSKQTNQIPIGNRLSISIHIHVQHPQFQILHRWAV